MSLAPEIIAIILAAIEALSLRYAREFFGEAKATEPSFKLKCAELRRRSEQNVKREMEEDLRRSAPLLAGLEAALGGDVLIRRRDEAVETVTKLVWDGKRQEMELKAIFECWRNWDDRGWLICGLGTFINMALIAAFALVIILKILKGLPLDITDAYAWTLVGVISLPLSLALICFVATYIQKHKFMSIEDE